MMLQWALTLENRTESQWSRWMTWSEGGWKGPHVIKKADFMVLMRSAFWAQGWWFFWRFSFFSGDTKFRGLFTWSVFSEFKVVVFSNEFHDLKRMCHDFALLRLQGEVSAFHQCILLQWIRTWKCPFNRLRKLLCSSPAAFLLLSWCISKMQVEKSNKVETGCLGEFYFNCFISSLKDFFHQRSCR